MAARFTSTLEPLAIANGRSSRFNTSQHKKEEKNEKDMKKNIVNTQEKELKT